jgi:chloramphenicol 3-O-phosphotransferase
MHTVDVLVLHGSPGSGKSTLARAISEALREVGVAHGVIDMDELSLVDPSPGRSFAMTNLRAIWPNYAAVPNVKMIIDTVIADEDELRQLRDAMPGCALVVCELTAPIEVLKDRVTAREPNEFWQSRLRDFVDLHHSRSDLERVRNLLVSTHQKPIDATAREVIEKAGWWSPHPAGTARNR